MWLNSEGHCHHFQVFQMFNVRFVFIKPFSHDLPIQMGVTLATEA